MEASGENVNSSTPYTDAIKVLALSKQKTCILSHFKHINVDTPYRAYLQVYFKLVRHAYQACHVARCMLTKHL